MRNLSILITLLLFISCKETTAQKEKQRKEQPKKEVNGAKLHFAKMEANALKETYKGIETKNGKVNNLFPIRSTGVSTKPIENAANFFLNSLSSKQKKQNII